MENSRVVSRISFIIPILLILFGPADFIVGVTHHSYPTQSTLISLVSTVIGIVLFRYNLQKLNNQAATTRQTLPDFYAVSESDLSPDDADVVAVNVRVNTLLGSGLLLFGMFFNFLVVFNGITDPIQSGGDSGNFVVVVVVLFFDLLIAALEVFGARIYTTDYRKATAQ